MIDLTKIATERRNPNTQNIDLLSTLELVRLINREDYHVPEAVSRITKSLAQAVDEIAERLSKKGRLFYIGCGTSGRLGIVDASECPPTYNTDSEMVQAIIAGGERAMFHAVEGAEDDAGKGVEALKERNFTGKDVLVGITASGRTPYVQGAVVYAKELGALTIGVTCNPGCSLGEVVDIDLSTTPGPEVVTGSTRMKAGSVEKMILNILTTATMVRLGKVYGNLMVDLQASNEKLFNRCIYIVSEATGAEKKDVVEALEACGYHCKTAIVMILCNVDNNKAADMIENCGGRIAEVLKKYK